MNDTITRADCDEIISNTNTEDLIKVLIDRFEKNGKNSKQHRQNACMNGGHHTPQIRVVPGLPIKEPIMGAQFDYVEIIDPKLAMTDDELRAKAEAAFEVCRYERGHGGYSGSLAEKTSVAIHRNALQLSVGEAIDYVCQSLDSDKWGPADIVPIRSRGWLCGGWCSN